MSHEISHLDLVVSLINFDFVFYFQNMDVLQISGPLIVLQFISNILNLEHIEVWSYGWKYLLTKNTSKLCNLTNSSTCRESWKHSEFTVISFNNALLLSWGDFRHIELLLVNWLLLMLLNQLRHSYSLWHFFFQYLANETF